MIKTMKSVVKTVKRTANKARGIKPVVYFAHPIGFYGTVYEAESLQKIRDSFPGCKIVNPSDKAHADACKDKMQYFIDLVNRECDVVIAMPYKDGLWGAGVYAEMQTAINSGKPVHKIHNGRISKVRDFNSIVPLSILATRRQNLDTQLYELKVQTKNVSRR